MGNNLNYMRRRFGIESQPHLVTDSGAVVSFKTGFSLPLKKLVVGIEPVQDLHGQSGPYPAGGGKNLLKTVLSSIKENNTSGTWNGNVYSRNDVDFTVNLDSAGNIIGITAKGTATGNVYFYGSYFDLPVGTYTLNGCPSGGSQSAYEIYLDGNRAGTREQGNENTFTVSEAMSNTRFIIFVARGYAISTNGLNFKPMLRLSSVTDPTFAPYSNICPISGWTGCNVSRTGVNVWDEQWEVGNISNSTGQNESSNSVIRSKNYISVKPNTKYYFKNGAGSQHLRYYYRIDKSFIQATAATSDGTFTTPDECYFVRFRMATTYGATYNHDISINHPSTDHNYHAYSGTVYPISWQTEAGTVYGGTLTVNEDGSGELVVDRVNVDLGTLDWGSWNESGTLLFNVSLPGKTHNRANPDCISSMYKYRSVVSLWSQLLNGEMTGNGNNDRIYVRNNAYTSNEAFKAGMSGEQIVYTLAEPIVYNLTNLEVIETLKGVNNVWADTGNITELKYWKE